MGEMVSYYQTTASYAEMLRSQDLSVFQNYIRFFKKFVTPNSLVLDIGCGVGTSTFLLRENEYRATGTDVSPIFLPKDFDDFKVVDFQNAVEIDDESFDAVGSMNVIEHVEQPQRFLSEISRVLKPGGHFILIAPNLTSPLMSLRIIHDLLKKRTPYLGIASYSQAFKLIGENLVRSLRAELGTNAFEAREAILDTGIVGYDADAIYWTNATEIKRYLEGKGFDILLFQKQGNTLATKIFSRLLPGFASSLCIVARKRK